MLQYYVFVTEMKAHVENVRRGLDSAGIDVDVHWVAVGQSPEEIVSMLEGEEGAMGLDAGGEAMVRVDRRQVKSGYSWQSDGSFQF